MGRGDKKTKKGKIFKGSFGKTRPANRPKKHTAPPKKSS
jgi:30S ribosomal protein S31